jgi:hypothetical protein
MILVEFGGLAVRCVPLGWAYQGICFFIGAGGLLWCLIIKLMIKSALCF